MMWFVWIEELQGIQNELGYSIDLPEQEIDYDRAQVECLTPIEPFHMRIHRLSQSKHCCTRLQVLNTAMCPAPWSSVSSWGSSLTVQSLQSEVDNSTCQSLYAFSLLVVESWQTAKGSEQNYHSFSGEISPDRDALTDSQFACLYGWNSIFFVDHQVSWL